MSPQTWEELSAITITTGSITDWYDELQCTLLSIALLLASSLFVIGV